MPEKPIEGDPDCQGRVDFLWALAVECCAHDPNRRPTSSTIVNRIRDALDRSSTISRSDLIVDSNSDNGGTPVYVWHDHTDVNVVGPLVHINVVGSVVLKSWAVSIAFSPDSSKLASYSSGGTISVWNAFTGSALFERRVHDMFDSSVSVAFSPDGSNVLSSTRKWEYSYPGCNDRRLHPRIPTNGYHPIDGGILS